MFSIVIAAAAATLTPSAAERAQLQEDAWATGMTARIDKKGGSSWISVAPAKKKAAPVPHRAPQLKIGFLETMLKNKAR